MRIRPAHLILAPFGVLLAGALFMLFTARSAQAVELGQSGSVAPGIVTEPVATVPTAQLPPSSADLSTPPIVPTSTPFTPTEQPALPASPSAVVAQVSQSPGAAADALKAPLGAPTGLVDQLRSQITEAAGGALDATKAPPLVTDTLAPVANALGGVPQDVGVGTPVESLLDQLTRPTTAPVARVLEGLEHSIVPPSGFTGPTPTSLGLPPISLRLPPTSLALPPTFQRSSLAPSQLSNGTGVRTSTLDERSFGNADGRAAPSTGMPRTSDPPGWDGYVASLVGAASAQGAERAGAGFVFAVLIAAVGLLVGRRRFMLLAQAFQAQRFVSVIVRPG